MKKAVIVLFLGILISVLSWSPGRAADHESAYARVMRTQTFRCGYGMWYPYFIKDPNTGKFSGIFYEYMNALGKALDIKVEWTEETDWTSFGQAIQSGRIDGFCIGVWENAARAREMDFTAPIFYSVINVYAREGDMRFDDKLGAIDNEKIRIATLDGEMSALIAAADFPSAKTVAAPQLIGQSSLMENLATGKADIAFTDPSTAKLYMKANPGKIRLVKGGQAIRVFGNTVAIEKNDYALKAMLDSGTRELLQSGAVDRIIRKYEKNPGDFPRIAKPYETAR